MRTLSSFISEHKNKKVLIRGWLHKKRKLGGLNFVLIRDRRGVTQVLVEKESEMEKLRGLQIGTVLSVEGIVHEDKRAPGGAELHNPKIVIEVPVKEEPPIEIDKPLSHKPEHLDTLFEYRALGLRNLQEQKIFKIRAGLLKYIREYLANREFVEIQTPKILAGATEGGAEVFKLDYFGQEATLAQSPQLYKQILVGVYERVFEIAPAFRAELSATTRHMSEVMMLDIEMGFIDDFDELLDFVGALTIDTLKRAYKDYADDLKSLNAPELIVADNVPKLTVSEIHKLYSQANKVDTTKETDLIPDEERWICEYAKKKYGSELVYATEFPIVDMKFYHKVNPKNPKTVLWGDLLFRGVEIATVPMREHRYDVLVKQMKDAGLDIKHPGYKYFLQAMKFGLPPHGGCGYGIDRLSEKVIGLANVKEATLFPRDINRLSP